MNKSFDLDAYENKSAFEVVEWALDTFKDKVALASSFSAEDVILIDILVKISKKLSLVPRIFTLDTGRLNQETYDVMDKIRDKYNIRIEVYFPNYEEVEEMVQEHGFNLFYNSLEFRRLCCNIRKVRPLNRIMKNLDAWICGLRKEQSVTRSEVKKLEREKRVIDGVEKEVIKINPIIDWIEKEVWDYIKKNKVPYNVLYDKGYTSIGCAPCTRPTKKIEDIRAGRWWWEDSDKKECGLHKR
ncbi:MAG: phosphoadenylyl-sulfate reductase [Endomicrobia bacterium]|nr:phosphoadenylyl-sulfate reductase [Endomicrobiia bacterium]